MDMDSNVDSATRGRCRVCLETDIDVVALSLTVCVFAEEITFSEMLKTCCAIEISASDLKPQTLCNHCAKTAEQSFTFRKMCQNADIKLKEELDGVNIKVESDEVRIKEDHEDKLDGDDVKVKSYELIIKQEHEEKDHKNGIMATIKDEFPDCASISNTDGRTQSQSKQNTSRTETIMCQICQSYFTDWISLEHHLENCDVRFGICEETSISDATLNKQVLTHEAPITDKKVIFKHKKLKCRFCKMSYKYPAELRNHIMTHTTDKRYLCLYCGNKFSLSHISKCERTHSRHSHKHIDRKKNSKASTSLIIQARFSCAVCRKSYRHQKTLKNHRCMNTSQKSHKCSQCGKAFGADAALRRHARTHTGEKPYECSYCSKRFSQQGAVATHERIHTGEKPYECSYCSKCFNQQFGLTLHERIHTGEKPYECLHCRKRFARQRDLNVHKRIHIGLKPYKCSHCSKRFVSQSNLKKHERTHTGEKPYECPHCSKQFANQSNLTRHEHTHTGEKPYECPQCSKRFADQSNLNKHERTHNGEKPLECSHCSKHFTVRSHLTDHERAHTGEKPIECSYCNKSFFQRSALIRHERTHTGEKPFECSHCSKRFSRQSDLNRHTRIHGVEKC